MKEDPMHHVETEPRWVVQKVENREKGQWDSCCSHTRAHWVTELPQLSEWCLSAPANALLWGRIRSLRPVAVQGWVSPQDSLWEWPHDWLALHEDGIYGEKYMDDLETTFNWFYNLKIVGGSSSAVSSKHQQGMWLRWQGSVRPPG